MEIALEKYYYDYYLKPLVITPNYIKMQILTNTAGYKKLG